MRTSIGRTAPLLVSLSLLASACGADGGGRLEFGIRRLALDIAFVDEDAAPPADPKVVVKYVPAPPEVLAGDFDVDEPLDLGNPEGLCPTAAPDATVGISASPSIIDPPVAGTYLRRNKGSVEIQGAGLPLKFPYPIFTAWEIGETKEATRPGPLGTSGALEPARQFTIEKTLSLGLYVTETFEMAPEALLLIERVIDADGVVTTIRPDPPVEVFHFGAEGDDWTSAGADTDNGYGMLVQGRITDRAVIDVCGQLVDTFQIGYTEQVVNLRNGETSGTNEATPSTLYIAPQFGGLIVQEDMHTIQRTATEDGSPFVVRLDYVSTVMTVDAGES